MAKRVLFVIDVLNDFLDPKGTLYCGDQARKVIPAIKALMEKFRERGEPIIYLKDAHAADDKEFELFAAHAIKGSWGAQIIPELAPPGEARVIDKTRFSALYGNNLIEVLKQVGAEEVWLTGVCTSICVMDTAGDLRNHDYRTVVPVDAVADFDVRFHQFALERMQKVYGTRLIDSAASVELD